MKSKTPYFILLIAAIIYNIWLIVKAEEEEKQKLKDTSGISVPINNPAQSK